jgi:hypothetical protein
MQLKPTYPLYLANVAQQPNTDLVAGGAGGRENH